MTFTTSPALAAPSRPAWKSPLRAATLSGISPGGAGLATAEILTARADQHREAVPAPELRRMQISEFTAWLRSRTNKHHRPFQADTIAAYADAARALDQWMTSQGIDGDGPRTSPGTSSGTGPGQYRILARTGPLRSRSAAGPCARGRYWSWPHPPPRRCGPAGSVSGR